MDLSLKFGNSVCVIETDDGKELEISVGVPEFLLFNISKEIWVLHEGDEVEIGLRPDPDYLIADYVYDGEPWAWWLRSPGGFNVRAANVWSNGIVSVLGYRVNLMDQYDSGIGIRPALWLYL